ncbi:MAG: thiamine pyrophosphate-binding protein [Rhodoferax sp.]|nr:thiamine pyrophosphate-binding protein [Rhodoferax sp.]MCF8210095.1 thiamine pyrophosphate-binding protein [Rhodoferax sp.]
MERSGHYAVAEQLQADGVEHIFGNPGTVEQGFLDALEDFPKIKYILTLQESVAIMAADAYARATRKLAVAQIHSSPGLGNAIGAMYQAMRGHSPLLVIGGDSGIRYQAMDAQMAADLVAMARPVTKWSTMVQHPSSLLRILRRAIKIASTPPMGPVYVCLPQDMLDAVATESVFPSFTPSFASQPDPAFVARAADMLVAAATPMIYVGDGVAYSGAQAELTRVAELLGAEVWGADCGELNMAYNHPLWQGQTGHMFAAQSRPITQRGDINLVVGTYMLPEVFPELGDIYAPGARTIHIDLNPDSIAKNHAVEIGMVADPKASLAALAQALEARLDAPRRARAASSMAQFAKSKSERRDTELEKDAARLNSSPLSFSTFARELGAQLPADAVIFDEALTNSPALTRYCVPQTVGSFFQTRGGSLGSALAGGLGLKAAFADRPVFALSGDGGAMYVIQSLWSAVRHNLDVKYIICNNASYRLLQLNIQQFWGEQKIAGRAFPISFDLSYPKLHFDAMARAMGMEAIRVETAEQIRPAIEAALAHSGPFLLDVVIEGDVHPELIGVRCGH